MKINYYNSEKDKLFNRRRRSSFKKIKTLTITFKHFLEMIQFEISNRGYLLWINTQETVRVFGYWKKEGYEGSRKFYRHWKNSHDYCC